MPTRTRPVAITAYCFSLVFSSFCQFGFAQQIGPPRSVVRGDPSTPTLVPDPAERFDEQQIMLHQNQAEGQLANSGNTGCLLPPLSGIHTPTVAVNALAAQVNASAEYEKACAAIGEKKFDSAEKHVRKALQKYPEYPALWVLLGQLLQKREQIPDAQEACLHAARATATFVPAYLCLADIAAHAQDWKEVLKESDHAIAVDSASATSYMFNADANFYLHHLDEAEKSALRASQLAGREIDPRQLHYLLAEICEARGDVAGEVAELREFLKVAGKTKEAEIVKQYLAKLSAAPGSAATTSEHH